MRICDAVLWRESSALPDCRGLRLASLNPAQAVGLGDRGEIAANRRADFVRVRHRDEAPMVRAVWREGERVV